MLRSLPRVGLSVGAIGVACGAFGVAVASRLDGWAAHLVLLAALVVGAGNGFLAFRRGQTAIDGAAESARLAGSGDVPRRAIVTSSATAALTHEFNAMLTGFEEREDALLGEQRRLLAVFSASSDPMVAVSADTTVKLLNSAAEALLGEDDAAFVGRPLIEGLRDHELDALVRGAVAGESATAVLAHGPDRIPVRALAVPIPGGGEWAALLVLTDLTEVHRVDQVRTDFVANVSHELQTPLTAIQAMAETLEMGTDATDSAEFLSRISDQTKRMTAIVRTLLDLSRIESGALELSPEELHVADVVREAAALFTERITEKRLALAGIDGIDARVRADPVALVRILTNLLDNATRVAPEDTVIAVSTIEEDGMFSLSVQDQGPGIPSQDFDRVFERFFKSDSSRSESGTGLGLAIVKHLIQAQGGTVTVASEAGHGATFTVTLPTAP